MPETLLSIIIPVYNVEKYLHQCLNSVYSQNLEACEVICVNDGSTDNSRTILQEFKDINNDLILIDRENGGLSAARNSGLKMANGKYVYFLDSDDYLFHGVLRKTIDFVEENELDLAYFNVLKDGKEFYFNNKKEITEVLSGKEYYKLNYEVNGFFPPSAVWTHLYKREFLLQNSMKFKEGIEHEDEEFTPRTYYFAQRVSCLNIPIQYHRVMREGSVTAATFVKFKERNIRDIIETCSDLYNFFKVNNCNENAFYLKVFFNYLSMARIIIERNQSERNISFIQVILVLCVLVPFPGSGTFIIGYFGIILFCLDGIYERALCCSLKKC